MGRTDARKASQRRYRQRLKTGDSNYVENETRGNSMIDPRSYKKDVPMQAWMDSRDIATLSEWLDVEERTKYMSEVVQEGIRILVEHLVSNGIVERIEDTTEARRLLEWKYKINLSQRKARGGKNALHNQVLTEKRRLEGEIIVRSEGREDILNELEKGQRMHEDSHLTTEERVAKEKAEAEERDKKMEEFMAAGRAAKSSSDEQSKEQARLSMAGHDEQDDKEVEYTDNITDHDDEEVEFTNDEVKDGKWSPEKDEEYVKLLKESGPDPSQIVKLGDE